MDKLKTVLKTLLAESLDSIPVAGSCLFLILSFFTAFVEPKAALLTLAISAGFYGFARLNDNGQSSGS